ncbi:hypothetical protein K438DRAFT_809426 [Mycena galopus ATCC 62051]|nr:hypothetical protein K438DRAFT_809426 [Mycena galopus ATCC 62051]
MGCARTRERDVDGDTRIHPTRPFSYETHGPDLLSASASRYWSPTAPAQAKQRSHSSSRLVSCYRWSFHPTTLPPLSLPPQLPRPSTSPPPPTLYWFSMPDTVTPPPPPAAFVPAVSISTQSCCASSVWHARLLLLWMAYFRRVRDSERVRRVAAKARHGAVDVEKQGQEGGWMKGGRSRTEEEGGGRREGGRGIRRRRGDEVAGQGKRRGADTPFPPSLVNPLSAIPPVTERALSLPGSAFAPRIRAADTPLDVRLALAVLRHAGKMGSEVRVSRGWRREGAGLNSDGGGRGRGDVRVGRARGGLASVLPIHVTSSVSCVPSPAALHRVH